MGAVSPSPSPVEAGAGLGLQPLPEVEAVGHHAGIGRSGVGAAGDAALPVRAAPRVGQDELWGTRDMGVITATATPDPASPTGAGAATRRTPGDGACPANRGMGKQQKMGVLALGTWGSWCWGHGSAGTGDMGVLALGTWGSWCWGHGTAGTGDQGCRQRLPCGGGGEPGLQAPTLAHQGWGHGGTGARQGWGHGRAGDTGTCSSRRVSLWRWARW